MDQSSLYQFCLASVTETFKQYVRESGEFLIVFSHFDDKSWQQKTLKVERELRKQANEFKSIKRVIFVDKKRNVIDIK